MILINKTQEPKALLEYRKLKHASYADMPGKVKTVVKSSLASEQGFLCAYCMSRLPERGIEQPGSSDVTIEHWSPQNPVTGTPACSPLDYRNMLAVCNGNRGNRKSNMTCDAAKESASLTVNPLDANTLAGIYYKANGEIHSSNADVENDLTKVLNLNCKSALLPKRRKAALDKLMFRISKKSAGKPASKRLLQQLLGELENESNKREPYAGILIYWLKKRLSR